MADADFDDATTLGNRAARYIGTSAEISAMMIQRQVHLNCFSYSQGRKYFPTEKGLAVVQVSPTRFRYWRDDGNDPTRRRQGIGIYFAKNSFKAIMDDPPAAQALANSARIRSAFFRFSLPTSPPHKSRTSLNSARTASRVPRGTRPLCNGSRPFAVRTSIRWKATFKFSERCTASNGWSAWKGQQILSVESGSPDFRRKRNRTLEHRLRAIL
jgi:hypothetical protein